MRPTTAILSFGRRVLAALSTAALDRRGAVGVEFGFVAIPLLFTIVAIFQIGYGYYVAATLDRAANAGARAVATGAVSQAGLTQTQFITQYVCPQLSANFSCADIVVNLTVVLKANSAPTLPSNYNNFVNATGVNAPSTTNSQNTFCPGGPFDLVLLEVLYPAPLFSGVFSQGSSVTQLSPGHNVYYLMSTATFKNEPFQNATVYPNC